MTKLVTVYGGSGFVGRYIVQRLAKAGWRIRVAVRRPNEAIFLRPYGNVGQVEPILCNIRNEDSVRAAMIGADAVVNCVGILAPKGKNTFAEVQNDGAERIARLASEMGISRMVQMSAIGADIESKSDYSRTKAMGERAVLRHIPDATILRPSLVFGPEDQFFNRFAAMSRLGPVLPVIGANTKFQPVYVDDVARAAVMAVEQHLPGTYELGGPQVATFRELMRQMLEIVRRRRLILNVPFPIARIMAGGFGLLNAISFGLIAGPVTTDQVRNLAHDNVVSADAKTFADLGIEPMTMASILQSYLWRFRPSGQYDAIKESAKNLRVD